MLTDAQLARLPKYAREHIKNLQQKYEQDALPLLPGMGTALVCNFHKGVWTVNFCKSMYAWYDTVVGDLYFQDVDFTRAVHGLREKVSGYITTGGY